MGGYCEVPVVHTITLGEIVDLIYSFKSSREERSIPNMSDEFTKKLYSTYLSYLPKNQFSYPLKMNVDHRGSFTEFIKTQDRGQVSVNISKPVFRSLWTPGACHQLINLYNILTMHNEKRYGSRCITWESRHYRES